MTHQSPDRAQSLIDFGFSSIVIIAAIGGLVLSPAAILVGSPIDQTELQFASDQYLLEIETAHLTTDDGEYRQENIDSTLSHNPNDLIDTDESTTIAINISVVNENRTLSALENGTYESSGPQPPSAGTSSSSTIATIDGILIEIKVSAWRSQ